MNIIKKHAMAMVHAGGRRALPLAAVLVLSACVAQDDVPSEATSPDSPLVAMVADEPEAAVPPAPRRPAVDAAISPSPEPPHPANLNDAPQPAPAVSDAHLDEIMDAQQLESEGPVPSGPEGMVDRTAARLTADPSRIQAPPGYLVKTVATRLTYPVDIAFSDTGQTYVAEAGGHTYGTKPEQAPPARILQIMPDGQTKVIYDQMLPLEEIRAHASSADMPEGIIPPITGLTWHDGKLYISHRSRYSTLDPKTGQFKTIVNGLPSWGEFLNAKPIFHNGKMVFFLSTQGNSGVIESHWIKVIRLFDKPQAHDIPGEDVTLTGINFRAPTQPGPYDQVPKALTGVYVPLGVKTQQGQVIPGQLICNGAFFRCDPDGSNLERIAWGFRSSFGYRYSSDGRLITTQNSANPMKPRGIRFDMEPIYEVVEGEWYGWPDFYSSIPITDERFKVLAGPQEFVLTEATHRELLDGQEHPREPLATLPVHSAAQGMVFGREAFGLDPDHILVAQFGSIVPLYKDDDWPPTEPGEFEADVPADAPPDVEMGWPGFRVSLVNLETGEHQPFLINKTGKPASATDHGGLERPIQLEWGPKGALHVVDFGTIRFGPNGLNAEPHTGVIWKITRSGQE